MSRSSQRMPSLVLIGAAFAIMGGFFCYLLVADFLTTLGTYGWTRVPMTIESLDVKFPASAPRSDESEPFELTGWFRYKFDGKSYRSNTLRRKPITSGSFEKLALRKKALIIDEVAHAYANPAEPSEAILERESLWTILAILLPLVFVLVGLSCVVGGLGVLPDKPPSKKKKYGISKTPLGWTQIAGGALFFLVGGALLLPMAILPMLARNDAKDWVETPCAVVWSRVATHESDDGDTYSVDVLFHYLVAGKDRYSNKYSFATGSSSGYKSKRAIVRQYPSGLKTQCFVDPKQPERAVLVLDLATLGYWWLIPTLFVCVGAFMLMSGVFVRLNEAWDS